MKIKEILFPVDFSECSYAMDREVELIANQLKANLTLLHVVEMPVTWYGPGEACIINSECLQQLSEEAKQRIAHYPIQLEGAQVNRVVAEGDPAWHIKNWVQEHQTDFIMMGTHGYGSLRRFLLGSVAMKVLHDLDCPVWTCSPEKSLPPKIPTNLICALELTEEAVPLLRYTKNLAQNFNASVRVVHVVPMAESHPYAYFELNLHTALKSSAMTEILKCQQEAGTDFPVTLSDGPIGQDLATLAVDQKADLILIGRGHAQATLGTLRTHAYEIIRQVPCPVLSFCPVQTGCDLSARSNRKEQEPALIAH